jgi:2-oxoglutarate ferredoxin oxidoreductase subunit alpha
VPWLGLRWPIRGRPQLKKKDFVVRFAGEGGQGFLTAALGFAVAHNQVGYHTQTFATFPSQITGGPTWMQARIATMPILSRGDDLDVLVVFNREAYEMHKDEVKDTGVIIYDSGEFSLDDDGESLGIPFDELAKSTGNTRAANMVVMGALGGLVNMPQSILEDFVRSRFTRGRANDAEIISSNIEALTLGRDAASQSGFSLDEIEDPVKPKYEQLLLNGNEALCLGAVAAGLQFYVGYPISPATTILTWMERNLVGEDRFVYQASSEIEAIASVVGASYGGVKAMSATSGPGFSLMGEGLGLAWMAEVPLVIADIQRGGPGTGLPTKTEQSDLFTALNPAHGDMRLPIIAPGTVEECFYAAVAAFNWAERYQGPVILLSEHSLAERQQNIPKPDLDSLVIERRDVYQGVNGYHRYEGTGRTPIPVPGQPGSYVANASEHDGMGDTTHRPERHVQMTERRFNKLKLLEDGTYEAENTGSPIAVMPWGGSKGPTTEAYRRLVDDGADLAWYYTMYINPLPPALLDELKEKELVLVPELNYLGQFASLLRSLGVRAEPLTQYTGLPFKVKDLVQRISERVSAERKEGVAA